MAAKSVTRLLGGLVVAASLGSASLSQSIASRILVKNVAIVGGGASGAHAALRLKEDYGKSIVVIEAADHLGGHVSSYHDPTTGRDFDYGLNSFNDYGPARDIFTRLSVSVTPAAHGDLASKSVDFASGQLVNHTGPAIPDMFAALGKMYGIVKQYESLMIPSYAQFPAPSAIPADLLLSFGEFVIKYSLQAAVPQIFAITGNGLGDLLATPTLYVLQAFGPATLESFLGIAGAPFVPSSGRNAEVYEAIATRLGSNVLYSSKVVQSLRTGFGVVLWVQGGDGKYTLVLADQLVMAIEPTPENIEPFNPTASEKAVFDKFAYSTVYAGIVSHPSLPTNASLVNTVPAAAPSNYLALPKPNFTVAFTPIDPAAGLWSVGVVGNEALTSDAAKALVTSNINAMVASGVLPGVSGAKVTFKAWAVHGAMHARVSAAELKADFIRKQVALQGKTSTWWTGAAWSSTATSILWAYNDLLLPKIVAASPA
ncbi:amine oxidase [Apodospora peruviana]|uniref:Amine oxidase n=1 Tax=Apodospora peruviana TaxID=516989 RepID=A0AAE0HZX7_9PEZI|nr:amine oxidase [Apodospora peruviana]